MSSDIDSDGTFDEENNTVSDTSSHSDAEMDTNDNEVQVTAIVAMLICMTGSPTSTRGENLSKSHKTT